MLKNFAKTAVVAAAICASASAANASVDVYMEVTAPPTGVIEVISENGTSWTKVLPGNISIPVKVSMGITSGGLDSYAIKQNAQNIYSSGSPDGHKSYQAAHTVSASTENFILEKLVILQKCNGALNVGNGIHEDQTTGYALPLTLQANFKMNNGEPYPPYYGYTSVDIKVICKGSVPNAPVQTAGAFKPLPVDFKIKDIDLFLTTFSGNNTQPNPATICKKAQVKVRVKTSKAGDVKFKLWTNVGGVMTSKVIDGTASHDGNGGFKAEHTEWISVNKPTYVQAKAEEMVSGFGSSTAWKDITLQCTNPGGGGIATNPNTNNDIPQGKNVDGDFAFIDHGSPKCTRTGKALITFRSPKPDNIHYSLDCKFDNHSGVLPTVPHPDGGYTAATLVSFDVNTTYTEACILRTVAPYGPEDHVNKTHLFQCVTTSGHSASNDVQVDSNPPSSKPDVPAKLVVGTGTQNAPSAPWQCIGGTVQGHNGCVCPPHKKLIYTQVMDHGQLFSGSKCVLSGPSDKTTKPASSSTDTAGTVKADAVKRRLEAAKQAAIAKRKRNAAAAKTLKLKAAKRLAKKAAIAKRKRDAAKMVAVKNAAAALRLRKARALKAAAAKRATAAALAKRRTNAVVPRRATLRKRAAPRSTSIGTTMQRRALRRR